MSHGYPPYSIIALHLSQLFREKSVAYSVEVGAATPVVVG